MKQLKYNKITIHNHDNIVLLMAHGFSFFLTNIWNMMILFYETKTMFYTVWHIYNQAWKWALFPCQKLYTLQNEPKSCTYNKTSMVTAIYTIHPYLSCRCFGVHNYYSWLK